MATALCVWRTAPPGQGETNGSSFGGSSQRASFGPFMGRLLRGTLAHVERGNRRGSRRPQTAVESGRGVPIKPRLIPPPLHPSLSSWEGVTDRFQPIYLCGMKAKRGGEGWTEIQLMWGGRGGVCIAPLSPQVPIKGVGAERSQASFGRSYGCHQKAGRPALDVVVTATVRCWCWRVGRDQSGQQPGKQRRRRHQCLRWSVVSSRRRLHIFYYFYRSLWRNAWKNLKCQFISPKRSLSFIMNKICSWDQHILF